ncbi:MAG TPA: hypothetical protein VKB93_08925 [Thermoanaerobaculia bacterium]|nr:hypothetical protein [Thermoanaerobaculia bacterium]
MSLRTAWAARFPSLPLRSLRGARNRFYAEHPEAFPDRGVRGLIASLSWPARLQPTRRTPADYPHDATPGWTHKLNGVAADDTHWYITQESRLHKVPLSHDLNTSIEGFPVEPLPDDFEHFGDLDVHAGVLYVPLERNEGKPGIATYNTNLTLLATKELPDRKECPWCAVNPKNGLVYSSEFTAGELRVYRPFLMSVIPVGTIPLFDEEGRPLEIRSIQGGAFSPLGHLYLLSDEQDGGIMGFDMITGRRVLHTLVDYKKFLPPIVQTAARGIGAFIGAAVGWSLSLGGLGGAVLGGLVGFLLARELAGRPIQELEGLALWNADGRAPGIGGQLHVQMIGLIPPRENQLFFKHYEADDERKDL